MCWKSIRLELARTFEFPVGSVSRAYLLRLPLDDKNGIDASELERHPQKATVPRHWSSEADERGQVFRDGVDWVLHCNGQRRTLHFNSAALHQGEQVNLTEANGDILPFRVASIR